MGPMDGRTLLDWIAQDLRYAARTAVRQPAFSIVAVATLALGIGAPTAIFSVINTILLSDPPYTDPAKLVTLHQAFAGLGESRMNVAPAEYLDYRDRTRAFASIAGYEDAAFDLTGGTEPVRIQAARVTSSLFPTLGVAPMAGRAFVPEEDRPDGANVVLLSHDLWQTRFAGNIGSIGTTIRLDEMPFTIVGVMPAGFEFPFSPASAGDPPDIWVPLAFTAKEIEDRGSEFPVHVVARLRPDVPLAQAQQDVERVASGFQAEHPNLYTGNVRFTPFIETLEAAGVARVQPVLLTLGGAVACVLLIACANVMNLLLARAATRQGEIAVRIALGAGGSRLTAQLLTEGMLMTLTGGVLGCALALAIVRVAASLWPTFASGLTEVRLDPVVLAFTLGLSALTGLACGMAPALNFLMQDVVGSRLKQAGRSAGSLERHRLRHALVVVEASFAVVLLIAAGLLLHSFVEVLRVPIGFSPDGVLVARTTFNRQRYPSADTRYQAMRQMLDRTAAVPGVSAVALATHIPLADDRQIGFILEGEDIRSVRTADNTLVTGNYFEAMGIPILRGRTFAATDSPEAPIAAIINDSMARRLFPSGEPLGKRLLWGGRPLTIVGIAGDVHIGAIDAVVRPTIYTPIFQVVSGATTRAVFIVRSWTSDAAQLASPVRAGIWSVDRDVPVFDVRTMSDIVSRSLAARRLAVGMLAAFAAVALLLAIIGLYGILSYTVAQKTPELGVRVALGATPGQVLRLVLRQGLGLTLTGIAIGTLVGAAVGRAMSQLLFGIKALDPITFATAIGALLTVSIAASYLPARRAAMIDPATALRGGL